MRGFQRLRRLELPLEIVVGNFANATSRIAITNEVVPAHRLGAFSSSLGGLVPVSVSELSLRSRGAGHHEQTLKVLFRGFAKEKGSRLSALKDIHLSCPENPDTTDAYKQECERLIAETAEAGVVFCLDIRPFMGLSQIITNGPLFKSQNLRTYI
jgi:hypothetical protein